MVAWSAESTNTSLANPQFFLFFSKNLKYLGAISLGANGVSKSLLLYTSSSNTNNSFLSVIPKKVNANVSGLF